MIKVATALRTVVQGIRALDPEVIKLKSALGRAMASDVRASSGIPGFDNSAMDGYAVKSADTKGARRDNPEILEVIEDIKAGDIPKRILRPNQAVRIMTGAAIPKGADCVVMVEDTKKVSGAKYQVSSGRKKEFVQIFRQVEPQENIRKAGEDIKKGELVLSKGTGLNSAHIGLLASLGKAKIKVIRKPKVAILATGDEVIAIDKKLPPGKIRSSNTYTLYSQVLKLGGIPKDLGIAGDDPKQLEKKIRQGLGCDLILTSGGVSVGDYDLVKDVLAKIGTQIKFWKIAMRPGKPLVFGRLRGKPIFGLPGNPVSSMVSFEIFVKPAVLKMLGQKSNAQREEVEAQAGEDFKKKKGFRYFLRANTAWRKGAYFTQATGPQGSGILKSMALANSLIILPEEKEFVKKGDKVRVRFLD